MITRIGQPEKGWPENDSQNWTARKDNQSGTAKIGQAEHGRQNRAGKVRQAKNARQNMMDRMGQGE
jgi:hypothetical protein